MAIDNTGASYRLILGDNFGVVTLESVMPDPLRGQTMDDWVVKGARTSYRGRKHTKDEDTGLIRYLLTHDHWSPVEQPHMTFQLRAPLMCDIHIMRHRTFHLNGESGRFKEVKDELYRPKIWRKQSTTNKQGSEGCLSIEEGHIAAAIQAECYTRDYEAYQKLLKMGVVREQARMVLPAEAMYKTYVITADLRNLFNFFKQRCASDAQQETRMFASAMYWLVAPMAPITAQVWLDELAGSDVKKNLSAWRSVYGEPATATSE